jgi:hypothetical protein
MADTIIENLITRFGFDFDQKTLDKIDAGIESAVNGLKKMVLAAGAAGVAMFLFTKKIAESNDELGKFAEIIGVDLEALQELGYVAELNGASVDSMNSSLSNLSKIMSEASRGIGGGIEAFGILGLSVTDAQGKIKETDDFLFEISDALSKIDSQAQRIEFASKLGIDESLILALDKGSDALRRQREEARELGFIIDEEAAQAAANFNDEMLRATRVVTGVANAIGQKLMKQMIPMIKAFVAWFKANKELIRQNILGFFDNLTKALQAVGNIAQRVAETLYFFRGALLAVAGVFLLLKRRIIAAKLAMLALNASALILPLIFAAIGVALFLLLEDLQKFLTGGESVIGKWVETFKKGWEDVKKVFALAWDSIARQTETMIQKTADYFKNAWIDSINFVKKKAGELLDFIPGVDVGTADALAGGTGVERQAAFGENSSLLDYRNNPSIGAVQPVGNRTTNNSTEDNRIVNINVNGGDLNEVRRTIEETLGNKFSAAKKNLKSNIAY